MKKFQYVMLLGSLLTVSNSAMTMQGGGIPQAPSLNQIMNQGGGNQGKIPTPPPLSQLLNQNAQNQGGIPKPPPLGQIMNQGGGNQGGIPQAPILNLNLAPLNQPINQGNNNRLQQQATLTKPQVNPQAQQGGGVNVNESPMMQRTKISSYLQRTLTIDEIKPLIALFSADEQRTKAILLNNLTGKNKTTAENNIINFLSDPTIQTEIEKLKQPIVAQKPSTNNQAPQSKPIKKTLIEKIKDASKNIPKKDNINIAFLCLEHLLENPITYQATDETVLKAGVLKILKGGLFGINKNKEATSEDANFLKGIKNNTIPLLNKKLGDLLTDNDFENLKQGAYFIKQGNDLVEIPVDQQFRTHIDTLKALIRGN